MAEKTDLTILREISKLRADIAILTTLVCDLDMQQFEARKKNGHGGVTPAVALSPNTSP